MKTNIYGPRPRNGGFRCDQCGATEYPLFGYTPRGRQDSNTSTCCARCLPGKALRGTRPYPTCDAQAALEALSVVEIGAEMAA